MTRPAELEDPAVSSTGPSDSDSEDLSSLYIVNRVPCETMWLSDEHIIRVSVIKILLTIGYMYRRA